MTHTATMLKRGWEVKEITSDEKYKNTQ